MPVLSRNAAYSAKMALLMANKIGLLFLDIYKYRPFQENVKQICSIYLAQHTHLHTLRVAVLINQHVLTKWGSYHALKYSNAARPLRDNWYPLCAARSVLCSIRPRRRREARSLVYSLRVNNSPIYKLSARPFSSALAANTDRRSRSTGKSAYRRVCPPSMLSSSLVLSGVDGAAWSDTPASVSILLRHEAPSTCQVRTATHAPTVAAMGRDLSHESRLPSAQVAMNSKTPAVALRNSGTSQDDLTDKCSRVSISQWGGWGI